MACETVTNYLVDGAFTLAQGTRRYYCPKGSLEGATILDIVHI
jgi:hypothetical protein